MVSLSAEQGQGGFFFGQEDNLSQNAPLTQREAELMHDSSSLGILPGTQFQPIRTHWIAILQILLFITYEVLMFLWNDVPSLTDCGEFKKFPFYVVLHIGLWLIIFLTDRLLQNYHHKSQNKGYLAFFRETKELRRLPFTVLSLGNAVLLVIFAVVVPCSSSSSCSVDHTPINILRIMFTIEFVIIMPGIIWYLVKVLKFNKAKASPDAEDPSLLLNGLIRSGASASGGELGVRDSECLDEVLEKQADMIRYLQQHNANLGRRLMSLMAQQNQTQ